ncbi:hypothetical protein BJY18_004263 [Amycolatopsis jiangsuensis]|uniref:Cation efflux protein transmembrane domain-containing protein n=1 Tax=Amycolatopsis jiangsuensis TaxID=1181879 RepID=A0A840J043_9PSEU|nr:hypothetical protein [Amycolatopsis jiangsuensis]
MAQPRHGHGYGHGREEVAGWWHRVKHAIIPHNHDSADRLDTAPETSKRGTRALLWSFVALSCTAVVQFGLVVVTGSVELLGDTIHNFADALTALPLGIAFVLSRRSATRHWPWRRCCSATAVSGAGSGTSMPIPGGVRCSLRCWVSPVITND